ncbi:MAG: HAD family hydrolase [Ruthenibacterium sp.]
MQNIKTVLWDWNGTLLNDVVLCNHLLNTLLTRHGYAPIGNLTEYRNVFCFPISEYYQKAGFDFTRDPFVSLADEYMTLYLGQCADCTLQTDAEEVLHILQKRGMRQAILSASQREILAKQVAQYGITSYFDALVGIDDVLGSSKIEAGRAWFEKSGIAPCETVMIGDSVHDFEVAAALGVHCVLYSGGHQPREKLAATGAPVIQNLMELTTLILR